MRVSIETGGVYVCGPVEICLWIDKAFIQKLSTPLTFHTEFMYLLYVCGFVIGNLTNSQCLNKSSNYKVAMLAIFVFNIKFVFSDRLMRYKVIR